MSIKEKAQCILNSLTDEQLAAFVTLFGDLSRLNFPNDETQQAIDEIKNGGGTLFTGTTEELFGK